MQDKSRFVANRNGEAAAAAAAHATAGPDGQWFAVSAPVMEF